MYVYYERYASLRERTINAQIFIHFLFVFPFPFTFIYADNSIAWLSVDFLISMTSSLLPRSDEPDWICMYILNVTIQSGTCQSILCNEDQKEAAKCIIVTYFRSQAISDTNSLNFNRSIRFQLDVHRHTHSIQTFIPRNTLSFPRKFSLHHQLRRRWFRLAMRAIFYEMAYKGNYYISICTILFLM